MKDPNTSALFATVEEGLNAITVEEFEKLEAPSSPSLTMDFMSLPFEIRLQIYRCLLPENFYVSVQNPFCINDFPRWNFKRPHYHYNTIFLLCKQITEEVLDLLYQQNLFKIELHNNGERWLERNFESNMGRMRHLIIVAQPTGETFRPELLPDDALWASILPQIKTLRIIAEQPVRVARFYRTFTLLQMQDWWSKWLRQFLECFARHISHDALIEVDANGIAETEQLVKNFLPSNCKIIRDQVVGDYIFNRGYCSKTSGFAEDDLLQTDRSWDAFMP